MKKLKACKVEVSNTSRIFVMLEDMVAGQGSLVHRTCVDSFLINTYWVRKEVEEGDTEEEVTKGALALSALLDSEIVYSGWRDLDYLEICWDGVSNP